MQFTVEPGLYAPEPEAASATGHRPRHGGRDRDPTYYPRDLASLIIPA